MKLVSASKLRKAREATEHSVNYMTILNEIFNYVYREMRSEKREDVVKKCPLLFGRDSTKYLLIVIGSDRGLCGAFNNNVAKEAKSDVRQFLNEGKEIKVLALGEKIYRAMKNIKGAEVILLEQMPKTVEEIKAFSLDTANGFYRNEFDLCKVYYTDFISPILQEVRARTLIPLQKVIEEQREMKDGYNILECHPNPISLLQDLLPQLLDDTIFSILQGTIASEHAARMTAMDNATRNADEMIDSLSSEYKKKRQSAITTELVEIISGAEVINQQSR